MLKRGSITKVADNSGAKSAKIIGTIGYSIKKSLEIGDVVAVAVQEAMPRTSVKKGEVAKAVIARTKQKIRRKDGSYISFDDNAVVLIDPEKKLPRGTRIFGPMPRELKELGFDKIISLASEVL